jgi:hypothetical protein
MVNHAITGLALPAERIKMPAATNKEEITRSFIAFRRDL